MNRIYLTPLLALFLLTSCKKSGKDDAPFSGTQYKLLGTYNSQGLPDYLTIKDSISTGLLSFISSILPNNQNLSITHPELFTTTAIGDITVTSSSNVYMTFVSEASGLTNSIAFYTYTTGQSPTIDKDIKVITYIFPNAGYLSALQTGDKVKLGKFDAGTSIGFVLLNNGWNIQNGTLDRNAVHWTTNDILNSETDSTLRKHAVLIKYAPENKVIIGFEDSDRSNGLSDNDFNDVVVYVTAN